MIVSGRHILTGSLGVFALVFAGGMATAGGGDKNGGANLPVPGTHVPKAPRPDFQPRVIVPGVNVRTPNIYVQQGDISVNNNFVSITGGSNTSNTVIFGGGGFVGGAAPVAPSSLGALNVQGGEDRIIETVTEQVPVTEETCLPQISYVETLRPVQALCIDDKGTPHPASRLTPDEEVAGTYTGEIFRCLAGTHMQVTLGQIENSTASFAEGETFSCRKGEALVQSGAGQLACAPARPQRNCNERSLLRRHGPGIKLVRISTREETCIPTEQTTYKTITREVERIVPDEASPIVLDGGVGQGVY